eukprot:CAMPEP_0196757290 /NCGR_PEP_ID=MMETSP1091-20130531/103590_1 /TAXON_ID=302021 /ORGANISM="Rhodomonas sp., Strain CCMP768" /LENGTH=217 /DNA_ID=CAMNT_0042106061 /DNA_START=64 /DNA_END=718 /DNA_ORIENTATION=-
MSNEIMQNLLDAHKRLGLRLTSSDSEVKSAYRKLAFELHPDRKGVSPHAGESAFKQVQHDYETIIRFREIHQAAEAAAAAAEAKKKPAPAARSTTTAQSAAATQKAAKKAQRSSGLAALESLERSTTTAQSAAATQKAATEGAKKFRFGRSGIIGTLGVGALLIGAGVVIETVKYKYVKPKIENSTIVRRMSNIYADAPNYLVAAPVEASAHEARTV